MHSYNNNPLACFIICFLCCIFFCHFASASTLIVTYHTGPEKERLDRIRFLLTDDKQHLQMYPRGNAYVDDPLSDMRVVVIDNLSPGEYKLEFAIPNGDGLFADVPKRNINITQDAVVKIDQIIKKKINADG